MAINKGLGTKTNPLKKGDKYAADAIKIDPSGVEAKKKAIQEFRREASRLAAMANKRVERLERNNLTSTPAYQRYLKDGGVKFSVRGKSYNEVQREVAKLKRFIDSETSTVRGANNVLKELAANTGIKYKNLEDLRSKSKQFFELASKVEQYLRNVEDIASAIGYQKIWEAINEYTAQNKIDLANADEAIDSMVEKVSKALAEYDEPIPLFDGNGWYSIKNDN